VTIRRCIATLNQLRANIDTLLVFSPNKGHSGLKVERLHSIKLWQPLHLARREELVLRLRYLRENSERDGASFLPMWYGEVSYTAGSQCPLSHHRQSRFALTCRNWNRSVSRRSSHCLWQNRRKPSPSSVGLVFRLYPWLLISC
jgi:hypothetical protein